MPAIVDSGAAYIAAKTGAGEPVQITDFVLAYIAGLDHTEPVDLAETTPGAGDIVYQAPVTQSGYLSPDKVVYSLAMDTSVGDFTFNWLGLLASDGTLVAVAYLPDTIKKASSGGVQGNNITRNFLLQFADAQLATGISVPAETWQIDQSAYLNAMDARERLSNRDIYGAGAFFEGGWQLVNNAGSYELQPGVGYVGGVRIVCTAPMTVDVGALPTAISLDVALQKSGNQVVAEVAPVRGTPEDYTDSSGAEHFVVQVADIDSGGVVTDRRNAYAVSDGVLKFLIDRISEQVPKSQGATVTQPGIVELATDAETQAGTDNARAVTPAGLASAVVDNLSSTSTNRPLSAAQGKVLNEKTGDASTTKKGLVELATNAETQAGIDSIRAVTPAGLASTVVDSLTSSSTTRPLSAAQGKVLNDKTGDASTTKKGLVELATNSETQMGTDTVRAVTPAGVSAALDNRLGTGCPTAFTKTLLATATAAEAREHLGLGESATRWPTWGEIDDKPESFIPAAHEHSADSITDGVFATTLIPNLSAGKITSGILSEGRIPDLDAGKIASGIFPISRGGTGASTAADARDNLGLGSLATLDSLSAADVGAAPVERTISAGTGLSGGGSLEANRTISLTNIAAGSSSKGALYYNGTTRSAGRLYGGSTNPSSSTRLNYDGYFNATRFYARSSRRAKHIERVDSPGEALRRVLAIGRKGVSVGHYKSDKQCTNSRWLIAEDVAEVSPEVILFDDRGCPASMDYNNLIPDLYAAVYQLAKHMGVTGE